MKNTSLLKLVPSTILLSLMLSSCLTFSRPTDEEARNYIVNMPDAKAYRTYFWRPQANTPTFDHFQEDKLHYLSPTWNYDYNISTSVLTQKIYDESTDSYRTEIAPHEKSFSSLDEFSRYILTDKQQAQVILAENDFLPFVRETFRDAETIICNGYRQGAYFYHCVGSWDLFLADETFKNNLETYIPDGKWDEWKQKTLWVEAKVDCRLRTIDPVFDIHIDPKENGAYEFRISLDWQHL